MEIWLKQDKISYRFPVIPSGYEVESTQNNTTVIINAIGEVNLLGKRNLRTVPLSSFFPKRNYYFCQYSNFPSPKESVKLIESMKQNGVLRLTITGTTVNMKCTIERFTYGEEDGTGDINFTLEFKEYRRPVVTSKSKQSSKDSKKITAVVTKRECKAVSSKKYTVREHDTLCKIAKSQTGTSNNWRAIYNQNKSVIGGNPGKIFPGQVLTINV